MFQAEIDAAVRQATAGRWVIKSRSPRSSVGELTVPADQVAGHVRRLQFEEHHVIISITCADHDDSSGCCDTCGQWAGQELRQSQKDGLAALEAYQADKSLANLARLGEAMGAIKADFYGTDD